MLNLNVQPTRKIIRYVQKKPHKHQTCDPQPGEKLINRNIPPKVDIIA